ncbi:hypothetical protein I552_9834 [Mycobacterium xenopi 3993]|nr:hypothetical protein I552_9834 [Mycobacterium xenopi 3993]
MTSIDLYVDPVCPFSWVTSRWLLDAAAATGRSVALRQMSLAVLNDGRDVEPAQRAKLEWSRRVGRVLAAATDEGGRGIRRSLRVAGRRGVQRGRGRGRQLGQRGARRDELQSSIGGRARRPGVG